MNGKMILYLIGQIMRVEGLLMLLPLLCALLYKEDLLPFLVPIMLLVLIGTAITLRPPSKRDFSAKEGFVTVGLSWILLSLFGCVPFFMAGYGLSFVDCFFETVSGFTTTGATILGSAFKVSSLPRGLLFWRNFTHWIGGMGVLVFMLAILPKSDMKNARLLHIMRAEATGPRVSKISEKLKKTARILYSLYIALTIVQIILLLAGGMGLYDSLVHSFATAGTGGFSVKDLSIGEYQNPYFDYVIGRFYGHFRGKFQCLSSHFVRSCAQGAEKRGASLVSRHHCGLGRRDSGEYLQPVRYRVRSGSPLVFSGRVDYFNHRLCNH